MRIGVVQFPGTCDERDAAFGVEMVGAEPVILWHGTADIRDVDAVIVPGGFSYGDYLRAGAIASLSPVMDAVRDFADSGGPVLGICNGFQVLCEAGLLPGALAQNDGLRFLYRQQPLRIEHDGHWTAGTITGTVLRVPLKNGEGRYVHDNPDALAANGQVLARYCHPNGKVDPTANPNGSVANIAGVTNEAGNVAGLMPHPEHAVDPVLGSTDGRRILGAALHSLAAT